MTPSAARSLLALAAVVYAAFGLAFALAPVGMAALVQIALPTPTARADFAATYGGLELGLAAFLAVCLRQGALAPGLLAAGCGLAGLGAVRLAYLLHGGGSGLLWALFVAEAAGAGLAFWAARRVPSGDPL